MIIKYKEIKAKHKVLVKSGEINIPSYGIYVITGNNGVGKTLLLRNILTKIKADKVYIGQDSDQIFKEISIKENILMWNGDQALLAKILSEFDLTYLLQLDPKKLSGGEKRLIILLRAICSEKQFLLIDEPTNDLDYEKVELITRIFNRSSKEKVFLIVTHDDRIKRIATHLYKIHNNELLEEITTTSAMAIDPVKTKKTTLSKKEFNKMFPINYILFLLACILFAVSSNLVVSTKDVGEVKSVDIDDQINVFMVYSLSSYGSDSIVYGGYPLDIIKKVISETDVWRIQKIIKEMSLSDYLNGQELNLINDIKTNEKYDVYKLEYYDPWNKQLLYSEDYLDKEDQYTNKQKILLPIDFGENEYSYFNKDTLDTASKKLEKENPNAILTYITIIPKKAGLEAVLKDPQIQRIKDKGVFIQSKETVALNKIILQYSKNRQLLISIVEILILCLVFHVISYGIYLYIKRKYIQTLLHYGMNTSNIIQNMNRRMFPKIIAILISIGALLANVIDQYYWHLTTSYITYSPVIAIIIYMIISMYITYGLNIFIINRLRNWRTRN